MLKIGKIKKALNTKEHLGGKAYGLQWMTKMGITVPPAWVIPTDYCEAYKAQPEKTMALIEVELTDVMADFTKHFGYMPLISVRSGARVSMPGMMDTVLNVGLSHLNMPEWSVRLGKESAIDCSKRLHEMYGTVVAGMTKEQVEEGALVPLPDTPLEQWLGCIEAVFKSWDNPRAVEYRKQNNIPDEWGTAVVLQAMVFGNSGENSATGVLFTRNPDTGDSKITGEYLVNAQGEDVVDGSTTPLDLEQMQEWNPKLFTELCGIARKLEEAQRDVQDIEFTIMDGGLYILQTRDAKRSPVAAVRIATDMVYEGIIDASEALKRCPGKLLDSAMIPTVVDTTPPDFVGIPACSGVAYGIPVYSSKEAVAKAAMGLDVILVTNETTPDDIAGMYAAKGILTMNGGSTSHAAVVARGMNKVCIVGLGGSIEQFPQEKKITLDGSTGRVWTVQVATSPASTEVVDRFKQMVVNDTPEKILVDSALIENFTEKQTHVAVRATDCFPYMVSTVHEPYVYKLAEKVLNLTIVHDERDSDFMEMMGFGRDLAKEMKEQGDFPSNVTFMDTESAVSSLDALIPLLADGKTFKWGGTPALLKQALKVIPDLETKIEKPITDLTTLIQK